MKQRKLKSIRCECGRTISARALTRHLKGAVNAHSQEFIDKCTKLLYQNRLYKYAWKKSEGVNGLRDDYWCVKVLNGDLLLDELTFIPPRKWGENPPKAIKKLSEDRKGKNNPSLINKPIHNIEEMKKVATSIFNGLAEDPRRFKKMDALLRAKFPNYGYSFVEMFSISNNRKRGHNRQNAITAFLIDKPIDWVVDQKSKDRGKLISAGQLKSPNLIKMVNAGRQTLKSHKSQPHSILFNMVRSLDKKAKKEKQIDWEKTWKSYDIFSPSMNILIEMHGRVWHDLDKCKLKMIPLVSKNIENDKIKEKLAKDNGYELFVFWDDEFETWESKLEEIYGKRPKSYEQALREELNKKRKR